RSSWPSWELWAYGLRPQGEEGVYAGYSGGASFEVPQGVSNVVANYKLYPCHLQGDNMFL
ncbi:MAG: hypothetical protein QXO67_02830, partial [Candidatus Bathyarchaeia archaeon]